MNTQPSLSEKDLEWITGLFEGEGCAGFYKVSRFNLHILEVKICQKGSFMARYLKSLLGFGSVARQGRFTGCYVWSCRSAKARSFLNMLLPRMRLPHKISQVKRALTKDFKWMTRTTNKQRGKHVVASPSFYAWSN